MTFFQSTRNSGGGGLTLRSSNPSWIGIKTLCLVSLLQLLQISDIQCAFQPNMYNNPDYTDELEQQQQGQYYKTLSDDADGFLTPSIHSNDRGDTGDEGNLLEKRHLGSVTALKDRFQFQPPQMTRDMLKRHLASIVSSAKQRQISSQMEKRYFGAVASKSGFRPGSPSKFPLDERFGNKRNMAAMAKINSKPFKRQEGEGIWDSGENSVDDYNSYPDVDSDEGQFLDNPVKIKTKRFLGSLARGNWFPRQFRGYVAAENPYDKRHIGSAARMGWLPLTRDRDDYFGEGTGFKRNIQSLKQSQFASPKSWGWGKQRE